MTLTRVKFKGPDTFRTVLNQRVEAHLAAKGLSHRDVPSMVLKTLFIFSWMATSYGLLMWGGLPWQADVLVCLSLGFAQAGWVFNVGHDGNHGSYSEKPWLNELTGMSYDLLGASSFLWRFRHNVIHHTYTNVAGVDFDISTSSPFMRTTQLDPWYWYHRFQHIYCWFIYGFLSANWVVADTHAMITGEYLGHKIPKPRPRDWAIFIISKFLAVMALVVGPLLAGRSLIEIAVGAVLVHWTFSVILAVTFQLAHVVEAAMVVYPTSDDITLEDHFAVHQLKTSMEFAPESRLLNFYLGGLNFQGVHHLFPKICHVRYPEIYKVVAEVAREHNVPYVVHPTLGAAVSSHFRVMRRLAQRPQTQATTVASPA